MTEEITIVTGLPRSGTSLMMKMLEAGGIEPLIDNVRVANEDNPGGYYEYEPVKRTKEDPSWLEGAGGKVVKMVYRLIYDLPEGYKYRLVLMRRTMDEILASQESMLRRDGLWEKNRVSDEKIASLFESELNRFKEWLPQQDNISVAEVWFNDLMNESSSTLGSLNEEMGGRLDVEAMLAIIDPSLYRNRSDAMP